MRLTTIEEVKNLKDSVAEVYVTVVLSEARLGSVIGKIYFLSCSFSGSELGFGKRIFKALIIIEA